MLPHKVPLLQLPAPLCPASWDSCGADKQDARERLREQEQGWVPGGVKAQQPLTPWGQPSEDSPCSRLSFVGQSGLVHTSTKVQHGLRAEDSDVGETSARTAASAAELVQNLRAQSQA